MRGKTPLADPPFSRLDLICCRNMLIYIEGDRQQEVLPMLHYALKPEGMLFLGASESVGSFTNLFDPVDKKYKIYLKKPGSTPALRPHFEAKHPGAKPEVPAVRAAGALEPFPAELNIQREADRVALDQYTPPSVLVNGELQILHFRGDTSPFLKPPKGRASLHLLKMAREGLLSPLRAAFTKAKKDNTKVRRERVRITQNGQPLTVNLEVVPLKNLKERCFLIFFEAAEAGLAPKRLAPLPPPPAPVTAASPETGHVRLVELEQELAEARDYLQAVQEQHEAALEELQASHEEISSANEELQSINEELETSKEELESSNEELTTLNQEMGSRNLELNRLNSDLTNLQASINMAILLLGRDLILRQFTPQAEKLFNLLATDIGRPLSAVRHNLDLPDLEPWVAEAIQTIRVREREVRDLQGRAYLLRARPYLTLDNKIDGAVLVLVDIDALKQAERGLRRSEVRYRRLFEASRDGVLILDSETRKIIDANPFLMNLLGYSHAELLGKELWEIGLVKDREASRAAFEQLRRQGDIHYEDLPLQTKAGERREVELIGHHYREDDLNLILCNIHDITQRKRDEAALREAQQQLQQHAARLQEMVAELEQYSYSITHDMRAPLRTMSMFSQLLLADYGPKLDETGRENLQRIHTAARRLDGLIQDVLAYSRLSRSEMTLEPVNLRQLVNEVIQHYPNLQAAQASFEIQDPLLPVLAHRTALMQCLSNLLGNAVKFVAPEATSHVKISSEPREGQVRVWIADNGIGIEPHFKERIWGIFQRGHTDKAYEGTGIGLSIVKKAIERMGGKVGVETEPGKGSRFWFQLPRAE